MALRDSMRDSAAEYREPGEAVQAVLGAQTAEPVNSAYVAYRGRGAIRCCRGE